MDYKARKRAHLQTQDLCTAQGLQFIPLVVDSRGAWGPAAVKTWQAPAQLLLLAPARQLPLKPAGFMNPLLSHYSVRTPARCSGVFLSPRLSRDRGRALSLPSCSSRYTAMPCLALSYPHPSILPSHSRCTFTFRALPASAWAVPFALARSVQFPGKRMLGFLEPLHGC